MDIRSIRLEKKIKFSELADKVNIDHTELRKIERGFIEPTKEQFYTLSQALKVDSAVLISGHLNEINKIIPGEGYTTCQCGEERFLERSSPIAPDKIKVLDLFCGCGGLSYGFEQTDKFQITAGVDLLADRVESFHANHNTAIGVIGNIHEIDKDHLWELAGTPDILIGGPPCQGFSSIRPFRQLSENDKRNHLVEIYRDLVAEKRPRWFVMENVVGLLTHNKGKLLESLLDEYSSLGYSVSWTILNAANYGVPQNRERLFIVGNNANIRYSWPTPTHHAPHKSMGGKRFNRSNRLNLFSENLPKAITAYDAICDLPEIESGETADKYGTPKCTNEYTHKMRGKTNQLSLHSSTKHSEKMMDIIKHAGENRNSLPKDMTSSGFSSCYSRIDPDKPSVTLTVNFVHPASNKCIHPYQHRALTPREGARIQSFPDNYTFSGSKTQIVKQIGNAVPPLLAKAVALSIYEAEMQAQQI
ncbi:MAG: DNA (cytosine-5-)-methyltransferase [Desulfovibrio sp.]|uniref:DNA (cytosine-5-)-methyltransferase n=1 Tax=Desulfovibrio sp. 7SRBS1 TaxID=3378064 RepID=UPI003B3D2E55